MPVLKITHHSRQVVGLWKITEDDSTLLNNLTRDAEVPTLLTHPQKRLEWMAGRILTRVLTDTIGLSYHGIEKDAYGKPFLQQHTHRISLTHSFPYVGVVIDADKDAGIDIEQPSTKLLRVAPRVLTTTEQQMAGSDVWFHAVLWCAKETLIKVYGRKDLTLAENLLIDPFVRKTEGNILGRIIVNSNTTVVPLTYQVFPEFVLVHT